MPTSVCKQEIWSLVQPTLPSFQDEPTVSLQWNELLNMALLEITRVWQKDLGEFNRIMKEKPQHLVNSIRSSWSILMKLLNEVVLPTWLTKILTKIIWLETLYHQKKSQSMTRPLGRIYQGITTEFPNLVLRKSWTIPCFGWQNPLPNMRVNWMTKARSCYRCLGPRCCNNVKMG